MIRPSESRIEEGAGGIGLSPFQISAVAEFDARDF